MMISAIQEGIDAVPAGEMGQVRITMADETGFTWDQYYSPQRALAVAQRIVDAVERAVDGSLRGQIAGSRPVIFVGWQES